MKCLDCGAEMEQGTAECVGAGFESWYEFTSETEKAKKRNCGIFYPADHHRSVYPGGVPRLALPQVQKSPDVGRQQGINTE